MWPLPCLFGFAENDCHQKKKPIRERLTQIRMTVVVAGGVRRSHGVTAASELSHCCHGDRRRAPGRATVQAELRLP